jgi:uncharacterized protein YbjQ (UPF0145 family)
VANRVRHSLLPPAAKDRLRAGLDAQLWASSLSVGDETALRSVGFAPVGVVTASVPSFPFAYRYARTLMNRSSLSPPANTYGGLQRPIPLDDAVSAKKMGGFSCDYGSGLSTGLLAYVGWSWQRVVHEDRQRQLFDAALDNLRAEAVALGSHGIVNVDIRWIRREALSSSDLPVWEVRGTGVAVRITESAPLAQPFSTIASGSQVAQMLRGGFTPAEAVFGIGVVCADIGASAGRRLRSLDCGEVAQFSEALDRSLSIAAGDLERRAAPFGDLAVGSRTEVAFDHESGSSIWDASCRITATAVRRFSPPDDANTLSILRLKPHQSL